MHAKIIGKLARKDGMLQLVNDLVRHKVSHGTKQSDQQPKSVWLNRRALTGDFADNRNCLHLDNVWPLMRRHAFHWNTAQRMFSTSINFDGIDIFKSCQEEFIYFKDLRFAF